MIKEFIVGDLNNHCYLVIENNKAILIDAGDCYNEVNSYLKENNIVLIGIILTHGHFDHAISGAKFQKDGVKIYISEKDSDKLYTDNNLSKFFGYTFTKFKADYTFNEGKLKIGDFEFDIFYTPGHSKGSVSIIYKNHIFVGDTIFENGYGRVDLYDGDFQEMKQSIKKLLKYKKQNYLFHYGH